MNSPEWVESMILMSSLSRVWVSLFCYCESCSISSAVSGSPNRFRFCISRFSEPPILASIYMDLKEVVTTKKVSIFLVSLNVLSRSTFSIFARSSHLGSEFLYFLVSKGGFLSRKTFTLLVASVFLQMFFFYMMDIWFSAGMLGSLALGFLFVWGLNSLLLILTLLFLIHTYNTTTI